MRIGVLCGGGDCPGLNPVIRGIVKAAGQRNVEVLGFFNGYKGLIEKDYTILTNKSVRGILPKGGTILATTNRDNPFHYRKEVNGETVYGDLSDVAVANAAECGLDSLIVIGGDGTMAITHELAQKGLKVIGVPKTIDNDLSATDRTFGFETAVNTATDAIDKLHTTAESHHRVMVLELMGRDAGFIALYAGLAGGADVILIPEIPFSSEHIVKKIRERIDNGTSFSIVVVAEGAKLNGNRVTSGANEGNIIDTERLGGIGNAVADLIHRESGCETRCTVLGHLQRGGIPAPFDRILSTRYGVAAANAAMAGENDVLVCLKGDSIETVPIEESIRSLKRVDPNGQMVAAARAVGISFGDGQ